MTEPLDLTHSWTFEEEPDPPARRWTAVFIAQIAVVVVVLAATVVGAAVLRNSNGNDELSVVKAASTSAAAQETLRATYELRISGSGLDVSSKGEMLLDLANKLSSGTIQAPGLGELQMVSADEVAYVQLPDGRVDSSGRHWLSFRSPHGTAAVGAQDPLAMLKLMGNPDKVETVGRETLHDIDTTHYSVALDPALVADAVANSGQNITLPEGTLDKLKNATIDVWVDGKKLPRRLEMAFAIEQIKVSWVFEYLDYGQPVDVIVPQPTDVVELSSPAELFARIGAAPTR
ncbi:MAG: hypothetical protein JJD92_14450 [Frankiaceae bacterium]|nr:hypothetical protein [Frankiaceae bacterium]